LFGIKPPCDFELNNHVFTDYGVLNAWAFMAAGYYAYWPKHFHIKMVLWNTYYAHSYYQIWTFCITLFL